MQKTESLENFSTRLRAAMARRGVTLQDVAAACGVAVSTVGAWTQAKNWPQVELQPKLAKYLCLSISFLFHGITEDVDPPIPLTGKVEEGPQATYGESDQTENDIRERMETLLIAAKKKRDRLGWISEQMREHLAVPKNWLTLEETNRRARELADRHAHEIPRVVSRRDPHEERRMESA